MLCVSSVSQKVKLYFFDAIMDNLNYCDFFLEFEYNGLFWWYLGFLLLLSNFYFVLSITKL